MQNNISGSIVELGLSIQAINVMIAFCIRHDKKDVVKKLKELILSFEESLTDEEKREVQEDMDQTMEKKADRLLIELESSFNKEEIDQILSRLKNDILR